MASISTTRSVLYRLSRSRVFFASASNYSDWRNAAEGRRGHGVYNSTMGAGRVAEDKQDEDMGERAKETMRDGMEEAKERAQEMKERTEEYAEKAKEGTNRAADTAEEVAESATETMRSVGEKAKQTVKGAWGAAKDTTQKIKETVVGKDEDERDKMRRELGDRRKSF